MDGGDAALGLAAEAGGLEALRLEGDAAEEVLQLRPPDLEVCDGAS